MKRGGGSSALLALEKRLADGLEEAARVEATSGSEVRLSALAREVAPRSASVRAQLLAQAKELGKAGAFGRELFAIAIRALVESREPKIVPVLVAALKGEDHGGVATLCGAALVGEAPIAPLLVRAAASGKTQIAFAAEVARACRGEPTGARLAALAPRVKEAHRIALTTDLLLPIGASTHAPSAASCALLAEGLMILAGSERHLGRWLVMADLAHRGRDARPLREATEKTRTGPDSSRAAWSLVLWALDSARGLGTARPTSELIARLSHRPSADRDSSFLFRMAAARVPEARPMLEALVRVRPLGDEVAVRAAAALVEGYGGADGSQAVLDHAERDERDGIRALASALLWDLGEHARAMALADGLGSTTDLSALGWAALVHSAAAAPAARKPDRIVTDSAFRRVQLGWAE
jgi:hypothetical protein